MVSNGLEIQIKLFNSNINNDTNDHFGIRIVS